MKCKQGEYVSRMKKKKKHGDNESYLLSEITFVDIYFIFK